MGAATDLGAFLTKAEALQLCDELVMTGTLTSKVLDALAADRRSRGEQLLRAVLAEHHESVNGLTVTLSALGGVAVASHPVLAWTSPIVEGGLGDTTLAASDLINQAERYVYAATYSGSPWSPYVKALRNVMSEKPQVRVTLLVDRNMQQQVTSPLGASLPGARVLALSEDLGPGTHLQHAKFVMVDGLMSLITSANFSKQAAERNLECGVILHDSAIANGIRSQIESLFKSGHLVAFSS